MPIQKKRDSTSIDAGQDLNTSKSLSAENGRGDGDCDLATKEGQPVTRETPEPQQEEAGDSAVSKTQERLARFKALQARAVSPYTYALSSLIKKSDWSRKMQR